MVLAQVVPCMAAEALVVLTEPVAAVLLVEAVRMAAAVLVMMEPLDLETLAAWVL